MSEIKFEIAKLFLKGRESNKALQEHLRFDRRLDEAELNIETLRANKSTPSKDIVNAVSELGEIEKEIEKKAVFEQGSLLTPEEYTDALVELSEEYFKLISENPENFQDVVFQVKSFDPMTTAKLDKITEDLSKDSPNVKRIHQSEFKGLSSFDSNNVFVMPLSEFENFSAMLKAPENDLKCVENPFFFVNHLNQDIPSLQMEKVLNNKYDNSNIDSLFAKELSLYVCPLDVRKVSGQRLPEIVNAFKEIIAQENLESKYDNPVISNTIRKINTKLRYPKTKEMVTVISESKNLVGKVEQDKRNVIMQKQINQNFKDLNPEPESIFKSSPRRM